LFAAAATTERDIEPMREQLAEGSAEAAVEAAVEPGLRSSVRARRAPAPQSTYRA
jgi:hypothetical protein